MRINLLLLLLALAGQLSAQGNYTPGQSYFGTDEYIEYIPGTLPLLLSAPHGGEKTPASIPDRDCSGCSYVNDFNTQELGRALAQALYERSGCYPHLVMNRLHRRKLDANRDLEEAADGNPNAEQAWTEFHTFMETARTQIGQTFGKGFYVDLHGHGHSIQRLELGYLHTKTELQLPDSVLNLAPYPTDNSIRKLSAANPNNLSHAELLRGALSLGALLHQRGYPAVPSPADPFPDADEDYFNGGYNTNRYGSYNGGVLDGVQIECNRNGIRDNLSNVERFADSLAVSLLQYLQTHYFGPQAPEWCTASAVAAPHTHGAPQFLKIYPIRLRITWFWKKTDRRRRRYSCCSSISVVALSNRCRWMPHKPASRCRGRNFRPDCTTINYFWAENPSKVGVSRCSEALNTPK
jgi:hypothetical protein